MRDIEYRLWDKKEKTMYDWDLSIGFLMGYVRNISEVHNDFIVMQYTGLKDKNGTKIYEGDICLLSSEYYYCSSSFSMDENWKFVGVVENNNQMYLFTDIEFGKDQIPLFEINYDIDIKVIGNIYENPELLKGE